MKSTKTYNILNLGVGVQSTALYLMFLNGEMGEALDYAVFAYTQEEPEPVYRHLEWIRSLGRPPIFCDPNRFVGHPWAESRFLLCELEMTRATCVEYLRKRAIPHGAPSPEGVFCPYRSNAGWRHLREIDPAGWARAVEVDEALRRAGTVANRNMERAIHLDSSCLPLVDVDLGDRNVTGGISHSECEGMFGQ